MECRSFRLEYSSISNHLFGNLHNGGGLRSEAVKEDTDHVLEISWVAGYPNPILDPSTNWH